MVRNVVVDVTTKDDQCKGRNVFKRCTCDWKKTIKRKLPITDWLPKYKRGLLINDLIGGFTVALTEIPQSIAYAVVAGLPLQYGLYSSFMGSFVYAIFGGCKIISMGSTSVMSILIQPHVLAMGKDMSTLMSFLGGIIILLLGMLHLGFIVDFFSYPVIAGFTSAAALTIASSQLKNLFGISGQSKQFLDSWQFLADHLSKIRKFDTVMGVFSLAFLILIKETCRSGNPQSDPAFSRRTNIKRKIFFYLSIGRNAIIVIFCTIIAYICDRNGKKSLHLTGHIDSSYPNFELPPFSTDFTNGDNVTVHYEAGEMLEEYGISMGLIPMVAIIETIALAKVFSGGKALDASQEMIALGLANIVGSFVGSMPVTGSFTRTALNHASGSKTNIAAVVTGTIILIAIGTLTSTFYYIPKSTLAAVIISAMIYLFEFHAIIIFWKNKKSDFIPFLATFFSSLFFSLEYGILIGIATNIVFILYAVARPKFKIVSERLANTSKEIYVVTPKSTIFFPAAEHLRDTVLQYETEDTIIVVDGSYIGNIDITVAKTVAALAEEVNLKNQKIVFLNFKPKVKKICIGVDKTLMNHFRICDIDKIIEDAENEATTVKPITENCI